MAFAQIYNCPIHGETWHPIHMEEFDADKDKIYNWLCCPVSDCFNEVKELIDKKNHPIMHALTDEEMMQENGFYE